MRRATIGIFTGFFTLICFGTILLSLPISTVKGQIPLIDAFFTSASAVCVTGLITVDTATAFTLFGKIVILFLFQLGGLGVITFSALVLLSIGRRISLLQRDVIATTHGHTDLKFDLRQVAKPVLLYVAISEGVGTIVLFFAFLRYFPWHEAFCHALFNAVSAFCNAGFSTFSTSMISFSGDWLVCLPLMALIVLGGLGFVIVLDIYETVRFTKPIYLHTRLVFTTTVILLVAGAVLFFVLEVGNALEGKPLHEQVLMSMFHSVTSRTAGFNSVDCFSLTHGTLMVTISLMVIGGSPGSTAGGIKTTTVAIMVLTAISRIRGKQDTEFGGRAIAAKSVVDAVTLVALSTIFILFVIMFLQITELGTIPHEKAGGTLMELSFEGVSAFGTVGLSMGATPNLSVVGKILIAVTMFIGRLGPLTFFHFLESLRRRQQYRLHAESVMVG
jgi:trk system potassium uptake protein TrkH